MPKLDQSFLHASLTTVAGSRLANTMEEFGDALRDDDHLCLPHMDRFDCRQVR